MMISEVILKLDKVKEVDLFREEKKEDSPMTNITPAMIHNRWEAAQHYKKTLELPQKWRTNDNFIAGDQWSAIPKSQPQLKTMARPVFNVVRQIANFKAASVKGESVKMIFSPFGAGASPEIANDDISDLGDLLNKLTEVTWEKAKLDAVSSRCVDRAIATGIGITYLFWDKSVRSKSKDSPFVGDIRSECLDAMYVSFGNPQELDVQKQPYIIVSGRKNVSMVKEQAKKLGMKPSDLELISSDTDGEENYTGSDYENTESKKVTVYTYFWKENGNIYYAKSTEGILLDKPKKLKLTMYPFAIFNWEERMECIYGSDEVSSIIPNQRAINGVLAMDLMSKQLTGFPKMLVDSRYIEPRKITNQIGEIITTKKANMPPGYQPISYIQPANQTNAVSNLAEMFIQKTKDLSGANDAVTGEANTNNASAIMLLQKSSSLPTEDIRRRYYQYIEDLGNLFIDFYKAYYDAPRLMQYKKSSGDYGEIDFNADLIRDVEFTIRSDIGASSVFSDANAVSSLDKLVQLGFIDKTTYVKLMPAGVMPFKQELLAILKLEAKLQQEIQGQMGIDASGNPTEQEQQAPPMSLEEQMMMESEAPPPEQAPQGQRLRLEEEYGQQPQ